MSSLAFDLFVLKVGIETYYLHDFTNPQKQIKLIIKSILTILNKCL